MPLVEQIVLPQEVLGKIIGPGGSGLRRITAATGAKVHIDQGNDPASASSGPVTAPAPAAGNGNGSATVRVYAPRDQLKTAVGMITGAVEEIQRVIGTPLSLASTPNAPALTVGTSVRCRVAKVIDFGVVLSTLLPSADAAATASADAPASTAAAGGAGAAAPPVVHELGWMHISEFSPKRSWRAGDVFEEGDEVTAMVVDVDARGKGRFSLR